MYLSSSENLKINSRRTLWQSALFLLPFLCAVKGPISYLIIHPERLLPQSILKKCKGFMQLSFVANNQSLPVFNFSLQLQNQCYDKVCTKQYLKKELSAKCLITLKEKGLWRKFTILRYGSSFIVFGSNKVSMIRWLTKNWKELERVTIKQSEIKPLSCLVKKSLQYVEGVLQPLKSSFP